MPAELLNIFAPVPTTKRGSPNVLGFSPKHNNILYACGRAIVIRNIKDPLQADMYFEHTCATTCAQYSPSGYYIASGDIQGNVRIWDTTQKEHPLKIELKVLSGPINDIAWSPDSQRVVVVGDGRERYGAVFMWDAGSSVGEISGHTKTLNTCDFKPTRPFRVITSGEDMSVNWFEGPPFKFKKSIKDNTRFVNCVRFSPDGNLFATASSDKKVILYDGKTGDKVAELPTEHKGGVYSLAWSPDSKMLLTASADKTVIFWDVAEKKPVNAVKFGTAAEQMITACVWVNDTPIALSLDGDLYYLSPSSPEPVRIIHGHNKFITAMAVDGESIITASFDARLLMWKADGSNERVTGPCHSNQISRITVSGGNLFTAGMDDTVRVVDLAKKEFGASYAMEGPVYDIDSMKTGTLAVAVTKKSVAILNASGVVSKAPTSFEATCSAISPDEKTVAVGGNDRKIHLMSIDLQETAVLDCAGELTCARFSPNGKYLATADSSRNIFVWDLATKQKVVEGWQYHSAKINSICWNPDSVRLASGGLDSAFYVWNVESPKTRIEMLNATVGGINAVCWINENTLITAGQDCAMKTWKISQ